VAGLALGGIGIAGLLAGGSFGILALIEHGDASGECIAGGSGVVCTPRGYARTRDAEHFATASTVGLAAGGVLFAAALTIYLTAPSPRASASSWSLSPLVGQREAGLGLRGSF
jgi:hypothetical protein